jgi:hypothetical protein
MKQRTAAQRKAMSDAQRKRWAAKKAEGYGRSIISTEALMEAQTGVSTFMRGVVDSLETPDPVNHPSHYTSHPSGVEAIQITEHFNFCVGNAIKYLWRAGEKGKYIEDLKKAKWYIEREINRVGE